MKTHGPGPTEKSRLLRFDRGHQREVKDWRNRKPVETFEDRAITPLVEATAPKFRRSPRYRA